MSLTERRAETSLREYVETRTHGNDASGVLRGSADKRRGYLLGVEEAIQAAEDWLYDRTDGHA